MWPFQGGHYVQGGLGYTRTDVKYEKKKVGFFPDRKALWKSQTQNPCTYQGTTSLYMYIYRYIHISIYIYVYVYIYIYTYIYI